MCKTAVPDAGAAGAGQPTADALSFDDALGELQRVVAELEAGGLPLERTLELYERGVQLHAHCGRLLTAAELRIQTLVERAGGRIDAIDVPESLADDEAGAAAEDDSALPG